MRAELVAWLRRHGGVCTRAEALAVVPAHVLDDAVNDRALCRILPCTYALPELASDRATLRRGALLFRPDLALSHLDALAAWDLPGGTDATGPVEAVTGRENRECKHPLLVVHRRTGFHNDATHVSVRAGLRVTRLEQTIVDCWSRLPAVQQRAPVLVAVRERRTTGPRLVDALAHNPRAVGLAAMRHLFGLVAGGCHSPLELWGHEHVFANGELALAQRQHPVDLGRRRIYLDRYYEEAQLAVELDGAAYHGEPGQRERDIRRDALVATLGIQTIRFSHQRLFHETAAVQAELRRVLDVRRAQLGRCPA